MKVQNLVHKGNNINNIIKLARKWKHVHFACYIL